MGQVKSHISEYFSDQSEKEKTNLHPESRKHDKFTDIKNRESKRYWHGESNSAASSTLATPRNPLKRSREISPKIGISVPQSILDIFSPAKKSKTDEFLDFPFLLDSETSAYYRKSKIMIILRGLPGSGKSTISKHIEKKYGSSKVCSADNFFMKSGEYKYDAALIKEAHAQCQKDAIEAVQSQTNIVVIDNTHLKLWEMSIYFELAKKFHYIPVVVESQTPWRRDLPTLVSKTQHNVELDIMEIKSQNFEELQPLYFGWFLNEMDSVLLVDEGLMCIEAAYEHPEFRKDFKNLVGAKSLQELLDHYKRPDSGQILHCTAKYIGKSLTSENRKYIESVCNFVGKAFDVEVVGFVLTPRTFGARLKLSHDQLLAWDKDDYEEVPEEFWDVGATNDFSETQENGADEDAEEAEETSNGHAEKSTKKMNGKPDEKCDGAELAEHSRDIENSLPSLNNHHDLSVNLCDTRETPELNNDSLDIIELKLDTSVSDGADSVKESKSPSKLSTSMEANTRTKNGELSPSGKKKKSPRKSKGVIIPENTLEIENSSTQSTLKAITIGENKVFMTKGNGSRAHLTLGCAPDVKAVVTGLDLIFAIQNEEKMLCAEENQTINGCDDLHTNGIDQKESTNEEQLHSNKGTPSKENPVLNGGCDSPIPSFPTINVNGAAIHNYGNGVWVIYPEQKLMVKSVFSASF